MLVSTKLSEISKIREHLGQLGACLRRLGRVLKSAKYFWPSTDELVAWIDRGRLTTLPKGAKLMCGLADADLPSCTGSRTHFHHFKDIYPA